VLVFFLSAAFVASRLGQLATGRVPDAFVKSGFVPFDPDLCRLHRELSKEMDCGLKKRNKKKEG